MSLENLLKIPGAAPVPGPGFLSLDYCRFDDAVQVVGIGNRQDDAPFIERARWQTDAAPKGCGAAALPENRSCGARISGAAQQARKHRPHLPKAAGLDVAQPLSELVGIRNVEPGSVPVRVSQRPGPECRKPKPMGRELPQVPKLLRQRGALVRRQLREQLVGGGRRVR